MRNNLVGVLIRKDFDLHLRNKMVILLSVITLILSLGAYFLIPEGDQTVEMSVKGVEFPPELIADLKEDGIIVAYTESEEQMIQSILDGDQYMGIIFPDNLFTESRPDNVRTYFSSAMSPEQIDAYKVIVKNFVLSVTGRSVDVAVDLEILGPDLTGKVLPMSERMVPLFVLMLLFLEIMGLAQLIVEEKEQGTAEALLTSPLKPAQFLTAKAVTGMSMAFIQVVLLLLITGAFMTDPLLMGIVVLLAAVMVVAFSFIVAALARDLMSVIGLSMLVLIILILPGMNILFPGSVTSVVKIIPSFFVVDTIHQIMNFEARWSEVGGQIGILLMIDLALLALGTGILRRKFV